MLLNITLTVVFIKHHEAHDFVNNKYHSLIFVTLYFIQRNCDLLKIYDIKGKLANNDTI